MDFAGECPVVLRTVRATGDRPCQPARRPTRLSATALIFLLPLISCSKSEPSAPEIAPTAAATDAGTSDGDSSIAVSGIVDEPSDQPRTQLAALGGAAAAATKPPRYSGGAGYRPNRNASGNRRARGYTALPPAPPPATIAETFVLNARPLFVDIDGPFPPPDYIQCYGTLGTIHFGPDLATLDWNDHAMVTIAGTTAAYCGPGTLSIINEAGNPQSQPAELARAGQQIAAVESVLAARRDLANISVESFVRVPETFHDDGFSIPGFYGIALTYDPLCQVSPEILYRGSFLDDPELAAQDADLVAALAERGGISVIAAYLPPGSGGFHQDRKPSETLAESGAPSRGSGGVLIGSSAPDEAAALPGNLRSPRDTLNLISDTLHAVESLRGEPILKLEYGAECSPDDAVEYPEGHFDIFIRPDPDPIRSDVVKGPDEDNGLIQYQSQPVDEPISPVAGP